MLRVPSSAPCTVTDTIAPVSRSTACSALLQVLDQNFEPDAIRIRHEISYCSGTSHILSQPRAVRITNVSWHLIAAASNILIS